MSGKSQKINGTKSTKNKHTLTRKITNGQKQSQEVSSSQQITSKNQSVLVAEANRLSVLLKEKNGLIMSCFHHLMTS